MLGQLETQPALIDQVHDRLVAAIVDGTLPPGQRLTQEGIAEMLGVSRQPVSHALQILKRRGLLIEHGKRGVAVAPMEASLVRDLYQVREALDGLAAGLAATRVRDGNADANTRSDLASALAEGCRIAGTDALRSELVEADVAFHGALYRLSGNLQIAATVTEQWPHFMRSMSMVLETPGARNRVWAEHRAIAAAVLEGDPKTAETRARAHTSRAADAAANRLREFALAD